MHASQLEGMDEERRLKVSQLLISVTAVGYGEVWYVPERPQKLSSSNLQVRGRRSNGVCSGAQVWGINQALANIRDAEAIKIRSTLEKAA